MRISDWSSDVCSSDLAAWLLPLRAKAVPATPSSSFRSPRVQDLNVIDQFMQAFIAYIDSGFGLLGGDVGFLTTILIGIDITLAGLFWALGGEDDVIGKFLKKILYVGDRKSVVWGQVFAVRLSLGGCR